MSLSALLCTGGLHRCFTGEHMQGSAFVCWAMWSIRGSAVEAIRARFESASFTGLWQ